MKQLVISAILNYDAENLNPAYDIDELVELIRTELELSYEELGLKVEFRDWMIDNEE